MDTLGRYPTHFLHTHKKTASHEYRHFRHLRHFIKSPKSPKSPTRCFNIKTSSNNEIYNIDIIPYKQLKTCYRHPLAIYKYNVAKMKIIMSPTLLYNSNITIYIKKPYQLVQHIIKSPILLMFNIFILLLAASLLRNENVGTCAIGNNEINNILMTK